MPISAVLLSCKRQKVDAVEAEIRRRPHAEVRSVQGGMVVVVTDTSTIEQDREEVRALEALPGVLTAHVVYANVEDIHLPPSSPPGGHDSAGELSP